MSHTKPVGSQDTAISIAEGRLRYVRSVQHYYDAATDDYMQYLGTTFQAGRFRPIDDLNTNVVCARRAGITSRSRVLDAGCGVGGPIAEIAAATPGVRFDGVTISVVQAERARELVKSSRAGEARIHVADFHALPFRDGVFDVILFLEAVGYAYDLQTVFEESYRVLTPGGILYIKEFFRSEGQLLPAQADDLRALNRIYCYRTVTVSEITSALITAGFTRVQAEDIEELIDTDLYDLAMMTFHADAGTLNSFGRRHYHPYKGLPIRFWQIIATKPMVPIRHRRT